MHQSQAGLELDSFHLYLRFFSVTGKSEVSGEGSILFDVATQEVKKPLVFFQSLVSSLITRFKHSKKPVVNNGINYQP